MFIIISLIKVTGKNSDLKNKHYSIIITAHVIFLCNLKISLFIITNIYDHVTHLLKIYDVKNIAVER